MLDSDATEAIALRTLREKVARANEQFCQILILAKKFARTVELQDREIDRLRALYPEEE